jgi:hypothetical protein
MLSSVLFAEQEFRKSTRVVGGGRPGGRREREFSVVAYVALLILPSNLKKPRDGGTTIPLRIADFGLRIEIAKNVDGARDDLKTEGRWLRLEDGRNGET